MYDVWATFSVACVAMLTPILFCNLGASILFSAALASSRAPSGICVPHLVLGGLTSCIMSIIGLVAGVIINGHVEPTFAGGENSFMLGGCTVGVSTLLGAMVTAKVLSMYDPGSPRAYKVYLTGFCLAFLSLLMGMTFVSSGIETHRRIEDATHEVCNARTASLFKVGAWSSGLGGLFGVASMAPFLCPVTKVFEVVPIVFAVVICICGYIDANKLVTHMPYIVHPMVPSRMVSAYQGLSAACAGIVAGGSFAIGGFTASRLAAVGRCEEQGMWFFDGIGIMLGPNIINFSGLIMCSILVNTAEKGAGLCEAEGDVTVGPSVLKLFAIPVVGVCMFAINWKFTHMTCKPVATQRRDVLLDSGMELGDEQAPNDVQNDRGM